MANIGINNKNLTFNNFLKIFDKNNNGIIEQDEFTQAIFSMSSKDSTNNSKVSALSTSESIFSTNNNSQSLSSTSYGGTQQVGESYEDVIQKLKEHKANDPGFVFTYEGTQKRQEYIKEGLDLSTKEQQLREGTARMEQIYKQGSSTPVSNELLESKGFDWGGTLNSDNFQIKTNILAEQVKEQGDKILSGLDEETLNNPTIVSAKKAYEEKVQLLDEKMEKQKEIHDNYVNMYNDTLEKHQWNDQNGKIVGKAASDTRTATDAATVALQESAQAAIELENAVNEVNNAKTPEEKTKAEEKLNISQINKDDSENKAQEAQANLNEAKQTEDEVGQTESATMQEETPVEETPIEETTETTIVEEESKTNK